MGTFLVVSVKPGEEVTLCTGAWKVGVEVRFKVRLEEVSCIVIVAVLWDARELPMFWAFRKAEDGIGEPVSWQATWRGVRRRLLSRLLSHCACTVRKLEDWGLSWSAWGKIVGSKRRGEELLTACYCVW